jgi:selenide,water dikinase
VRDDEVKFGLAVTGLVDPARMLRNSTAKPGDVLLLTKPLGTGALAAALKRDALPAGGEHARALIATMAALNACGPALAEAGAHAATDVTGFGLTGHALEMAEGSGVRLAIDTAALPLLPDAVRLCGEGFTCGGTAANADHVGERIAYADALDSAWIGLLHDPQTSGGLLVSVPGDRADAFVALALNEGASCAAIVGEVLPAVEDEPLLLFRR